MSAVISDEGEAIYGLEPVHSEAKRPRIAPEHAYEVSSQALEVLQERIDAVHEMLIGHERDRRRRFNASWLGRLLPFLRQDPDAAIRPETILHGSMRRWVDDIAELRMNEHYAQCARSILVQAQNTPDPFEVNAFDWMCLEQLAQAAA